MAKRQSQESRVLQYFRTAPQAEMELVFGLVTGEVKARRGAAMQPAQPKVRKTRRSRKTNATAPGGTAFEPAALAQ